MKFSTFKNISPVFHFKPKILVESIKMYVAYRNVEFELSVYGHFVIYFIAFHLKALQPDKTSPKRNVSNNDDRRSSANKKLHLFCFAGNQYADENKLHHIRGDWRGFGLLNGCCFNKCFFLLCFVLRCWRYFCYALYAPNCCSESTCICTCVHVCLDVSLRKYSQEQMYDYAK